MALVENISLNAWHLCTTYMDLDDDSDEEVSFELRPYVRDLNINDIVQVNIWGTFKAKFEFRI
jgi:hypothetical protein